MADLLFISNCKGLFRVRFLLTRNISGYHFFCNIPDCCTKIAASLSRDTNFYDFSWSQFIPFVFVPDVPTYSLVSYNNKKSGEPPDKVKGGFKQ